LFVAGRYYQTLNFDGLFSSLGQFSHFSKNRGKHSNTCTEGEKLKCIINYFECMKTKWNNG
jgi:hypothetical protein